jgi:hypothetical protein
VCSAVWQTTLWLVAWTHLRARSLDSLPRAVAVCSRGSAAASGEVKNRLEIAGMGRDSGNPREKRDGWEWDASERIRDWVLWLVGPACEWVASGKARWW